MIEVTHSCPKIKILAVILPSDSGIVNYSILIIISANT